jgi:hypothetical protein
MPGRETCKVIRLTPEAGRQHLHDHIVGGRVVAGRPGNPAAAVRVGDVLERELVGPDAFDGHRLTELGRVCPDRSLGQRNHRQ